MHLYFKHNQVPEWQYLSDSTLKRLSKDIGLKVLLEKKTILGVFLLILFLSPLLYWSIVIVKVKTIGLLLTIIFSGLLGFLISQWHISRMRAYLNHNPEEIKKHL
ncbi:MAG: hypothetical protein COA79_19075 [Planctomycetota bacterium]|nr:MAG: hypothetical protein COA79_19075 [Planctomycetota bacterium]